MAWNNARRIITITLFFRGLTMRRLSTRYERFLDDLVDEIYERAAEKWTWSEFARAAGICYGTVARMGERKTRLPQLRTIYLMAEALGMDVGLIQKKARMALKKAA